MSAAEATPTDLAPPPRRVSTTLRLHVLFGGGAAQFGWIFFGFGLVFFWIFFMNSTLITAFDFRGALATTNGTVRGSEESGVEVNEVEVVAVYYTYTTPDEVPYDGVSFNRGRWLDEGADVTVEYVVASPGISRIRGMRAAPFSAGAGFVVIFPAVGLALILVGLRKRLRASRLLARGELVHAEVTSKKATGTVIGDRKVYKMTFKFTAYDGREHSVPIKSHRLEAKGREVLLYDPARPTCAMPLAVMPGNPELDHAGGFCTPPLLPALVLPIVPAASVIGHGLYAWFRYAS